VRDLLARVQGFELTPEIVVRVRLVLLLSAVLALILAFQMGDDWYVREFANYDWARHIGY
jgi:hypothetical protein